MELEEKKDIVDRRSSPEARVAQLELPRYGSALSLSRVVSSLEFRVLVPVVSLSLSLSLD